MRKVTDEVEVKSLLSVDHEWVIFQAWNNWEEKKFNLNNNDVKEIIKDLNRPYLFEGLTPWIELHDDGSVIVQYPNTCRLERRN